MSVRILTVRQPWAWAIIHGGKNVENRVRNIAGDYRGPVAIHAAKANDHEAWLAFGRTNVAAYTQAMSSYWSLVGGAIIGIVDLLDVHVVQQSHDGTNVCFDDTTPTGDICSRWAHAYDEFPAYRGFHMVLANPRPLSEPIPYRGALGLRRTEFEIVNDYLVAPWGHPDRSCTPYGCEAGCHLEPVGRLVTP